MPHISAAQPRSTQAPAPPPAPPPAPSLRDGLARHWPMVVGLLLVGVPTLATLADQSWAMEAGAHGPIVLATGLWLLWHIHGQLAADARPAPAWAVGLPLVVLVPAYALGRALDLMVVEAGALYGIALLCAIRLIGLGAIRRNLFPFLYFAFLIPPPGWALDMLTSPLRRGISGAATGLLSLLDYPVAREGVVIYIGPYQLLVEDACSGMNSLVGLTAISLFYIYLLHRAHWRHAVLLMLAVIPIAIIANLLRVITLILITYYFGDAVAQGFVHNLAGIMLFSLALVMVVGTD
ncbi:MAG: exosortase V, partial [Sphingopyxis sp.]